MTTKTNTRNFIGKEKRVQIAVWKTTHPSWSIDKIAKKFGVGQHHVDYAFKKYSQDSELANTTRKGKAIKADILKDGIDETEAMKSQQKLILATLENDKNIPVQTRTQLLYTLTRIRMYLQRVELSAHLKKSDADIIGAIVRRFKPDVTNDEIVKIYYEELEKWKNLE